MEETRPKGGIYVHVPFCRRKCLYCDFYSIGDIRADWHAYVDAILRELEDRLGEAPDLYTLYIGGGTPSLIPQDEFERLADGLLCHFSKTGGDFEFTIEVNPDDVTEEKISAWKRSGVNRISMGVQSLNDEELHFMGRRHNARQVVDAYQMIRKEINNISLDVIFGVPGQTRDSVASTIEGIIEMRPEHVSAYSLMYEEGTVLTQMCRKGQIRELDEGDSVWMFEMLSRRLEEAGYEQYELSNYALPGFRSRHNSSYWYGYPYLGLGPGAHSYDGDRRRSWNGILDGSGYSWERAEEILTDDELREEMIMTRLRTREGIDLAEFESKFGQRRLADLLSGSRSRIDREDMHIINGHLSLTKQGIMISDEIISDLF